MQPRTNQLIIFEWTINHAIAHLFCCDTNTAVHAVKASSVIERIGRHTHARETFICRSNAVDHSIARSIEMETSPVHISSIVDELNAIVFSFAAFESFFDLSIEKHRRTVQFIDAIGTVPDPIAACVR